MILVCGEALIDLVPLPQGGEPTYVSRAGGSSFNVAMGLGRLGIPVGFLGRCAGDLPADFPGEVAALRLG